jgi:hypothetical protein
MKYIPLCWRVFRLTETLNTKMYIYSTTHCIIIQHTYNPAKAFKVSIQCHNKNQCAIIQQ